VKVICIVKVKIMPTRVEKDKADASDIAVHYGCIWRLKGQSV